MKLDYLRSKISNYKPIAQENSLPNSKLAAVFVETAKLIRQSDSDISFIAPMASKEISSIFKNIVDRFEMSEFFYYSTTKVKK